VNGGPLPPNVIHEPLSLFDEHGRYVGENVTAAVEPDVIVSATAAVDAEVNSPPASLLQCLSFTACHNTNTVFATVNPSVRPAHSGIVSKRGNAEGCGLHCSVAQCL